MYFSKVFICLKYFSVKCILIHYSVNTLVYIYSPFQYAVFGEIIRLILLITIIDQFLVLSNRLLRFVNVYNKSKAHSVCDKAIFLFLLAFKK